MKNTYSVREAVLRTGYTRKHICDLLYARKIPGARKIGREWRIPDTSLARLEEQRKAVTK